jgi:hypothetical protein
MDRPEDLSMEFLHLLNQELGGGQYRHIGQIWRIRSRASGHFLTDLERGHLRKEDRQHAYPSNACMGGTTQGDRQGCLL